MCEWCDKVFEDGDRTHPIEVLGFERYICGACQDRYDLYEKDRDYYGEFI